MADNIVR